MTHAGSFSSEVFVYGNTFRFNAQFTRLLWTAQVFNAVGDACGSLSWPGPPGSLEGDELEDAVSEWVYRGLQFRAAFPFAHAAAMAHPRLQDHGVNGQAANSASYRTGPDDGGAPARRSGTTLGRVRKSGTLHVI